MTRFENTDVPTHSCASEDDVDTLFRKANFAAEDGGFREKLWLRLHKRMTEMNDERELTGEEASALAAAGQSVTEQWLKNPEL